MGYESEQVRELDKVKAFEWVEQKKYTNKGRGKKVCLPKPGTWVGKNK